MFNSDDSEVTNDGISPTNSVEQDALFVNEWSDLQLQSGSPCINAGTNIASVTDDYLEVSRPQGGAWDMGAYESLFPDEIGTFQSGASGNAAMQ